MKGIFLDDVRWPVNVYWVEYDYTKDDWIIVRTFEQFVDVLENENIDLISFDHDLDETSTMECLKCAGTDKEFNYSKVLKKTGLHCAKFLKEWCEKRGRDIPQYLVHSLNAKGSENIQNLLGKENLIAGHSNALFLDKADEILARLKNRR